MPTTNALLYVIYAFSLISGSLLLSKKLYQLSSITILKACSFILLFVSLIFIIIFYPLEKIDLTLTIIVTIIYAIICGISAPLTLTMCMHGFTRNKGAASAVQSFVRMLLTGLMLMFFNYLPMLNIVNLMIGYFCISLLIFSSYTVAGIIKLPNILKESNR
jgi:hypothetical protein